MLRVVEQGAGERGADEARQDTEEESTLPNITNPFFELEYNRLAMRCAELFARAAEVAVNLKNPPFACWMRIK